MREPRISDHALMRYLERALGIDMGALRAELLSPERCKLIEFGAKTIKVDKGRFIICDGHIVTFISKEQGVPTNHIKGAE